MKVEIKQVAADDPLVADILTEVAYRCSEQIWVGLGDDKLVVVWGLIPPTILSDTAYLWSLTTPAVARCRKTFVKLSRLALARLLADYPVIIGRCTEQSHWLRWLGAEFGERHGDYFSFVIRA